MAKISRRNLIVGASAMGVSFRASVSWAAYPERPITLIVPAAAGGSVDIANRAVAEKVSVTLGQPVVVEFRPGAGATLGAGMIARAAADGGTIGFMGVGLVASQALGKPLGFDVRNFVPLGKFFNLPYTTMVSSRLNINSLKELADRARAEAGKLNFGSVGIGSAQHIATELFMNAAGVKLTHIPYQSGAIAIQDLIAGRLDVYFDGTSLTLPMHKTGQAKVIAITGKQRSSAFPEIATFEEQGFGDAQYDSWGAWIAPPKFPADYTKTIGDALGSASKDEAIRKRFAEMGFELTDTGPQQLATLIDAELVKYERLGKEARIKLE